MIHYPIKTQILVMYEQNILSGRFWPHPYRRILPKLLHLKWIYNVLRSLLMFGVKFNLAGLRF